MHFNSIGCSVCSPDFGFSLFHIYSRFCSSKMLKLEIPDEIETILFSVGLSIAFLMLIGFLVNELGT